MDDTPHRDAEAPAAWLEALARGEAQIASGQTVPLEPVLDRLRARIARMKENTKRVEPKTAREA